MQEQQQTQYYDKLLMHLNRAFLTNLKTQQLYLDLKKHTRKLRFKSIKNIYNTLTEGKADEIIYNKDKPILLNQPAYNSQYTERTCWRLIQKLINKIAYYLSNQRNLCDIAPSILKAIGFTRNASQKISQKARFFQFFSEVVDSIIAQSNFLQNKIYELLIQRGYIYSIDQFYRMSRFEDCNSQFIYANKESQASDQLLQNATIISNTVSFREPKILRSKKRLMSIRKVMSRQQADKIASQCLSKQLIQSSHITVTNTQKNQDIIEHQYESQSSQSQSPQFQGKDKISRNIHTEVAKAIEQIMNHQSYQNFLSIVEQQSSRNSKNSDKRTSREPAIKQILKNLNLRSFKTNETILTINQNQINNLQSQKKKSKQQQKLQQKKTLKKNHTNRNRPSIATALSKRMREKVFKNQGLEEIQELIIHNLGKLEVTFTPQEQIQNEKVPFRQNRRLQTQNFDARPKINTSKNNRKSSNLNFFNSAFVFAQRSRFDQEYVSQKKGTFTHNLNFPSPPSTGTQQTLLSNRNSQFLKSHKKFGVLKDSTNRSIDQQQQNIFTNQKLKKTSNFGKKRQKSEKFRNKLGKHSVNATLLELTAKKYNKYTSQSSNIQQNLQQLFLGLNKYKESKYLQQSQPKIQRSQQKQQPTYIHHKKYQTYDRIHRKLL